MQNGGDFEFLNKVLGIFYVFNVFEILSKRAKNI